MLLTRKIQNRPSFYFSCKIPSLLISATPTIPSLHATFKAQNTQFLHNIPMPKYPVCILIATPKVPGVSYQKIPKCPVCMFLETLIIPCVYVITCNTYFIFSLYVTYSIQNIQLARYLQPQTYPVSMSATTLKIFGLYANCHTPNKVQLYRRLHFLFGPFMSRSSDILRNQKLLFV